MNADIYEQHRQAVEEWRSACEAVRLSEELRDRKRQALDNIGQELLASCAIPKQIKPGKNSRRGRKPNVLNAKVGVDKVNGVNGEALRI